MTARDDAGTHSHLCIWCDQIYGCINPHAPASDTVRPGGRCCPSCRAHNLAAVAKWETRRRRRLYVG